MMNYPETMICTFMALVLAATWPHAGRAAKAQDAIPEVSQKRLYHYAVLSFQAYVSHCMIPSPRSTGSRESMRKAR